MAFVSNQAVVACVSCVVVVGFMRQDVEQSLAPQSVYTKMTTAVL